MANMCYIIAFNASDDEANLIAEIKKYGTWAKITPTTWAVVTDKKAVDVRDSLLIHLKPESRLFVVKSGVEGAWRNTECRGEWLKNNL